MARSDHPRRDAALRRSPRRAVAASIALVLAAAGVVAIAPAARADGPTTFSNAASIAIPATGSADQTGPASPYPSPITVAGMAGTVSSVQVAFNDLTHSTLNDVDAMLVAPSGQNLVVLSDIGDPNTLAFANGATLTFDDAAAGGVPSGNVPTGTYRPTNTAGVESFPAPAPAPSAQTTLAGAFTGIDPNGVWSLFIVDDATGDIGQMAGGWSLIITTQVAAAATTTAVTTSGTPSTTGSPVTFTASVTAGGSPVTAGTVSFAADGVGIGTAALLPSGAATLTTSALAEGTHAIVATYSGTAGFLTSNGSVTQRVDNQTVVTGSTYCNPGPLTIPGNGPSVPYPSNITVSGLTGPVTKVTATLNGLSHTVPVDLDVMLSGPVPSTNVVLMSDVGGTAAASGTTLVFDDAAAGPVPTPLVSGTFRPTDDDSDTADAAFPAPAPAVSAATTLATFNGATGNGVWSLWVVDDATGDAGSVSGGWCLTFAAAVAPVIADAGGPYAVAEGGSLTLDGSGSTAAASATYEWDLNGDGATDATGATPTLSWDQLESLGIDDGPSTHAITLEVTVDTQTSADTAELEVTNTAPDTVVDGALTATAGVPFTIKVGADDPSSADMAALFDYTVDWGDGSPITTVSGPADPPVTHTYAAAGTYTASLTSTDKDGGTGEPITIVVVVAAAPSGPRRCRRGRPHRRPVRPPPGTGLSRPQGRVRRQPP